LRLTGEGQRRIAATIALIFALIGLTTAEYSGLATEATEALSKVLTGRAAMGDWTTDAPGVRRKIMVDDLPAPLISAGN